MDKEIQGLPPVKPEDAVVIGMDPAASRNCGWAVVRLKDGVPELLEKGTQTIERPPEDMGRLDDIYQRLDGLITKHAPLDRKSLVLCTERQAGGGLIFVRGNLNEVVGVAKLCCYRRGVSVVEESPAHLKKIIAGHGRAKKKDIKANIVASFGLVKAGPEHECDAAACALCCLVDLGWSGYQVKVPFAG